MTTREEIERVVRDMHNAHYSPESPHGLVKPHESPNVNTIYRMWNDGEISYEKGGDAFGDRSVKQYRQGLCSNMSVLPRFPLEARSGYTYAILTVDECECVYALLKEHFDPFLAKRIEVRVSSPHDTVDATIREITKMRDIRVVYRSPRSDMFVVQSLSGTVEEVQTKLEETMRASDPDGVFVFTRVD